VHISSEALQEIATEEVHGQPLTEAPTFSGRVQYSLDGFAKIGTPLVGIVRSVPAKLGDRVTLGQTLVIIESADIGVAYSDFAKAESDFQLTQRYLELSKDLYLAKSLSKKEFDQAQNDFNKAEAELSRSRQRLLTLRVPERELNKPTPERHVSTRFDLKAPLKGIIVERNVTVGQVVGQDPTQTLFTVADLEVLQVVAEIYERDLRLVRVGLPANVTVQSFPNDQFPAKVVYVGDMVDPNTRTIKVRCDVKNINYKLKPEMFARVQIQLNALATTVVLPREAVLRIGNDAFVFVERSVGEYERRAIVVGPTADDRIEIRNGVNEKDRVVIRGVILLKGALEKKQLGTRR
jgi:cobalt-zinc-cadmium efflux system membrane fusion protein